MRIIGERMRNEQLREDHHLGHPGETAAAKFHMSDWEG